VSIKAEPVDGADVPVAVNAALLTLEHALGVIKAQAAEAAEHALAMQVALSRVRELEEEAECAVEAVVFEENRQMRKRDAEKMQRETKKLEDAQSAKRLKCCSVDLDGMTAQAKDELHEVLQRS
jgi:hypothetical protein